MTEAGSRFPVFVLYQQKYPNIPMTKSILAIRCNFIGLDYEDLLLISKTRVV